MDRRVTEAQKALERWSKTISSQWVDVYAFITDKGLDCDEIIRLEVGSVIASVSVEVSGYRSEKNTGSMHINGNLPVTAFATNPDLDISLLPKIRETIIAAIEAKKEKAEKHLKGIEKALGPLRPEIAEQVLEEGRKAALSGGTRDLGELDHLTPGPY